MEPAAPGTEEIIDLNAPTKKETENQRLLNEKAILRNGKYENIFELSYVDGTERWYCKICERPMIGVYQHAMGRKHMTRLQIANRQFKKDESQDNLDVEEISDVEVAPGEPVPPGEKVRAVRQAQIQERLDGFKVAPLVALEYLIEMYDYYSSKEPLYLCLLCDKRGDPRTVLTHLASYNHLSQYLQKHFPSCYRALAPYMTKQYKRNWQLVLHKIAEAIEKHFGRLKPFCIERDKFERDRMQYVAMISEGPHFSEQAGPSFVQLVVHEELTKTYDASIESKEPILGPVMTGKVTTERPFKKRSPSPPEVAPPVKKMYPTGTDLNKPGPNKSINTTKPLQNTERNTQQVQSYRRRSLSSVSSISSDDNIQIRKRSPKRQYRQIRRRSPSLSRKVRDSGNQSKDYIHRLQMREKERLLKLEEFKRLCKAIENDMEKTLKSHEKNPEKHPKYNDEWKLFWNRRYKEIQAESKDATKHDFKPEWIDYWGKKMLSLHHEELKVRKEALRKRLGLPEEKSRISFRIGPNLPKADSNTEDSEKNKPVLVTERPDDELEVILSDDDKDDKGDSASNSPWERESPPKLVGRQYKNPSPQLKRSRDYSTERRIVRREEAIKIQRSVDRRSFERLRRSRSRERSRRSRSHEKSRRSRSHEKSRRSRSHERLRSPRSRDSRRERMKSPVRSLSRDRRSRSHSSYRARHSKDRDYRDRRGYSKERSRERERHRKSSFERELQGKERIRTVADLPWEKNKFIYTRPGPPSAIRDCPQKVAQHYPVSEDDNEDVNIVSLLRLLTALEEKLGSLGPKIIDLLAQALALEKREPNSSESLLDSDINCVMFETVKEKLKGQLSAGLVDPIQERAFKKAIQRTASLIHYAGERKRKMVQFKSGDINKAVIAKQLANALVAQGKTDVTQEQLEQLINTVVGMAEASKASKKPITAAAFLSQLTGENSERDFDHTDLDKLTEPLSPSTPEKTTNAMENLSDSDLQTLLQNFKDLSDDEQMNLINYLKKLELDEPDRVERLRKFVNLGQEKTTTTVDLEKEDSRKSGRDSPFSSRLEGLNPDADDVKSKNEIKVIHIDSEEEDYSYEDVVKAVSKNIRQQEIERCESPSNQKESNLTVAKALISNLMSTFSSNTSTSGVNLLGLSAAPAQTKSVVSDATSSADFVKNLGNINMDNLARIVNSVQKVPPNNQQNNINQEPPVSQMDILSDDRSNSTGFSSMSELPGFKTSHMEQNSFNHLSSQAPRATSAQSFRNSATYMGPRSMVSGPPPHMRANMRPLPVQGYPNTNPGQRVVQATPAMFNQRLQYSDNVAGGNQNQNFPNTRPGRPLLNLTFGNPRFRGPNPGPPRPLGPNNFNRW
ncbi:hypothetical protein GWI33_007411 [Rhynchophorus ferrugineus]|uniref:Uncharacterized protein n=1 Tax=Rhynchophorus ferrugineus TaxID=354439 RepID=A0A834IGA9_RHYFE|nr:hypothetical protein GWI33_007411 [Rhynchophorus ferrugineus]